MHFTLVNGLCADEWPEESFLLYSENGRLFWSPLKVSHRVEGPVITLQMALQSTCMYGFFEGHTVGFLHSRRWMSTVVLPEWS